LERVYAFSKEMGGGNSILVTTSPLCHYLRPEVLKLLVENVVLVA